MGEDSREFTIDVEWVDQMAFKVHWDLPDAPDLLLDEPPELGGSGEGPNAARMAVAAVANCLGASLKFCLDKSRVQVDTYRVRAHGRIERNERGRLRLKSIRVEPLVTIPEGERKKLDRCMGMFEDFCIVTESVRRGMPVDLQVHLVDGEGNETPVDVQDR
jgi:organic hydroperoxide reductase OsmC/OhrA